MKRKIKYWLMGAGLTIGTLVPILSVVSCSEITRNSATNSYYAFSTTSAISGSNVSNSTINDVAMNNIDTQKGGIVSQLGTGSYANLSSVTSWYFSDAGTVEGVAGTKGLGYVGGLNTSNGTPTSSTNTLSSTPSWLQQNNAYIVQQLFSSLLNYLVGTISVRNYLGQNTLEASDTSWGLLRLLLDDDNSITSNNLSTSLMGSENKVNIGSFAQNLRSVTQSSDKQTSYYLFPTDIFYNVTTSTIKTNATYWNTTTGNSKYSSLLASYMPTTIASNTTGTAPSVGKSETYDGQISVAKVQDIQIVFEFYCSAPYADYTSNQPINCTQTKNIDLHNGTVSYPEIDGKQLNYNPYYGKYYVLNINPIDVSLQNIGVVKSSKSDSSSSSTTAVLASSSSSSSSDKTVNLDNYAALNYYGSLNESNYNVNSTDQEIYYNQVNSDLTKLSAMYNTDSYDYQYYYHTPAASWCFDNSTITNLYNMQQQIDAQAKFYFDTNANVTSNTGYITSTEQTTILSYINGLLTSEEIVSASQTASK